METCSRVAVLSDVHGNAVAFAAVLDELEAVSPDLVVFGGDLTWGPLPRETLALARELRMRTIFVRGNAERALSELAGPPGEAATPSRALATGAARGRGAGVPRRLRRGRGGRDRRPWPAALLPRVAAKRGGADHVRAARSSNAGGPRGIDERVLVTAHTHI